MKSSPLDDLIFHACEVNSLVEATAKLGFKYVEAKDDGGQMIPWAYRDKEEKLGERTRNLKTVVEYLAGCKRHHLEPDMGETIQETLSLVKHGSAEYISAIMQDKNALSEELQREAKNLLLLIGPLPVEDPLGSITLGPRPLPN